jgi:hypothetical protein
MQRLEEDLPDNAILLADANAGGAYAYAISGVKTIPTHLFFTPTYGQEFLFHALNDPNLSATSCQYIHEIEYADQNHPKQLYVLELPDSKLDLLADESGLSFLGLYDLPEKVGAQIIDQQGAARLVKPVCN